MALTIREFKLDDAQTVFKWRNDPYIANLGSLQRTVTWEEHIKWFNTTINGTNRKAFITEVNNLPAGQVRFDKETESACFISVYLIKEFAGNGYGVEFIKLGCKEIFLNWESLLDIYAVVRRDNKVGQKAFIKAGFKEDTVFQDETHFSFVLRRL